MPKNRVTLESLPPETLTKILGYLKHFKPYLKKTSLVSKRLHAISLPLLYETVIVYFDTKIYNSLQVHQHQGLPLIKNFGIRGCSMYFRNDGTSAKDRSNDSFIWLLLSVLRRFGANQLRNFIWMTDMSLTNIIANELKDRQKLLRGVWFYGADKTEPTGNIHRGLFEALDKNIHLQHLHMGGINTSLQMMNVLSSLDYLPAQLQSLTLGLVDKSFVDELLNDPEAWAKLQSQFRMGLPKQFTPDFPRLTYLSLHMIGDRFFERMRQIDELVNLQQLETLKLIDTGQISSTLYRMKGRCPRLKVFYLWGSADDAALSGFLKSVSGLKELSLEMQNSTLETAGDLGFEKHCHSLVKLYARFLVDDTDLPFGSWFLEEILTEYKFPNLTELACSLPTNRLYDLREYDYKLPRMRLFWLLGQDFEWMDKETMRDNLTNTLRYFFRYSDDQPRWRFFVTQNSTQNYDYTVIHELCESRSICGDICPCLAYIPHRDLFNHDPDLTLLNVWETWLPWEEERVFREALDEY